MKRYISGHDEKTEGIYVIRDGKKLTYEEAVAAMEVEHE